MSNFFKILFLIFALITNDVAYCQKVTKDEILDSLFAITNIKDDILIDIIKQSYIKHKKNNGRFSYIINSKVGVFNIDFSNTGLSVLSCSFDKDKFIKKLTENKIVLLGNDTINYLFDFKLQVSQAIITNSDTEVILKKQKNATIQTFSIKKSGVNIFPLTIWKILDQKIIIYDSLLSKNYVKRYLVDSLGNKEIYFYTDKEFYAISEGLIRTGKYYFYDKIGRLLIQGQYSENQIFVSRKSGTWQYFDYANNIKEVIEYLDDIPKIITKTILVD